MNFIKKIYKNITYYSFSEIIENIMVILFFGGFVIFVVSFFIYETTMAMICLGVLLIFLYIRHLVEQNQIKEYTRMKKKREEREEREYKEKIAQNEREYQKFLREDEEEKEKLKEKRRQAAAKKRLELKNLRTKNTKTRNKLSSISNDLDKMDEKLLGLKSLVESSNEAISLVEKHMSSIDISDSEFLDKYNKLIVYVDEELKTYE